MPEALGEFEHHVLLAILRRGSTSYSVDIVRELEERTGKSVGVTSIFVTLRRLETKGLLTSEVIVPDQGHKRRYFSLTPAALDRLESAREAFLNLWDGVLTGDAGAPGHGNT
ncbi:MAG: PadR family transcriptional regulator [Gemmatimonadetes bacterium]|nr:PadR family transcriptional regulator [Gemmatimonadota bacterium]NNM33122.1 PadR family transcriptional regulator [Gemmatimonadota bacterium]